MLRVSVEMEGEDADYRGISDPKSAEESSVPGAGALIGLVEASYSEHESDRQAARERVRRELGFEALVDAAGVIGNFERMVRIADGTGIPLDAPVNIATESVRETLGIDAFGSAENTSAVRGWQRMLGRVLQPVIRFGLRRVGKRAKRRSQTDETGAGANG